MHYAYEDEQSKVINSKTKEINLYNLNEIKFAKK